MLRVESLSYKTRGKYLIEDISMELQPGIINGIIGPNGSGKTTFLKVLTGIWKAASGKVFWQDADLFSFDRHTLSRTISLVPQNANVNFDFTVEEVVEMGTYSRSDLTVEDKKKSIQWALERVNAWHLRNQCAMHISHGERQRMYIARSLVTQSPILILDEPTSNLDLRHQLEIWELLQQLSKENKLIIVANHDLQATTRYCKNVVVFDQGHCIATGPCLKIINNDFIASIFGIAKLAAPRSD